MPSHQPSSSFHVRLQQKEAESCPVLQAFIALQSSMALQISTLLQPGTFVSLVLRQHVLYLRTNQAPEVVRGRPTTTPSAIRRTQPATVRNHTYSSLPVCRPENGRQRYHTDSAQTYRDAINAFTTAVRHNGLPASGVCRHRRTAL